MYSMKRIVWICGYFRVMFRYVHILTNLSVNSHIEYHNIIFSLSHWSNFMIDVYFLQRFVWICRYFRVMCRYVHILTNLSGNSHIEYHNMIFSLSYWSNFMIDMYFLQRFVWICSYFRVMFRYVHILTNLSVISCI